MKSYYRDMAELIDKNYRYKVKPAMTYVGELKTFEFKKSIFRKIKEFFIKNKLKKELKKGNLDTKIETAPIDTSLIKSYVSFSGADLVVNVGAKVVGELTNIRWYKPHQKFIDHLSNSDYYDVGLAVKKPVVVLAEWAVFDKELFPGGLQDATITMTFANEYGQSAFRSIHGVESLYEISGISIDEVMTEGYMILAAEEVTDLQPSVLCQEDREKYKIRFGDY